MYSKTANIPWNYPHCFAILYTYQFSLRAMVWYGMVWYGMVWYGMVWYGMVWYGMVWYGMVWYGMVWFCYVLFQKCWMSLGSFMLCLVELWFDCTVLPRSNLTENRG